MNKKIITICIIFVVAIISIVAINDNIVVNNTTNNTMNVIEHNIDKIVELNDKIIDNIDNNKYNDTQLKSFANERDDIINQTKNIIDNDLTTQQKNNVVEKHGIDDWWM